MKSNKDNNIKPKKKGQVIPAGTEQETGLTRGETEKPENARGKIKKQSGGENRHSSL